MPALASFRRQLLFNEIAIMVGASILMMWLYRLDPREVLSLKPVKPAVWLAILFAIPAGYITALGIFRVVNIIIPAPQQMLERFSDDLIPKGMPSWQLLLYVSVLPAVCEELAFRGILLNGLRRKFRPAALIVGIGLIFGLFHMTLYRIAPTAALGMVLTAIALMTGSVLARDVAPRREQCDRRPGRNLVLDGSSALAAFHRRRGNLRSVILDYLPQPDAPADSLIA